MENDLISVVDCEKNIPWSVTVDGFFKKNVEKQLLRDDSMTQDSVNSIFSNASRILSRCPNPSEDRDIDETGIIIGKVQSGKTSNFISVLALAFDNGYDMAIVLGGNTLELLKQNASRIFSSFNVDDDRLTVLKTNDNKSLINPSNIKEFIENGRKVIIVGLKHYKHITQIGEIFENEYLSRQPVLIIDDEGDQATLNTKAYLKSVSSTYEAVVNLKNKLKRHCLLSITATPQANIMIEVFDKLSPDFGELVYPGEGYCGLHEFHGEDNNKYIIEIPKTETNLLDGTGVPESLYKAMALFFVGNAIRYSRGDFANHAMLIHPSQKKFDHRIAINKVQSVLDDWKIKAKLVLDGNKDISYKSLRKQLHDAYKYFKESCNAPLTFDEIETTILSIIRRCSPVHLCNSDENASENARLFRSNIFVGGNLVERGITIKGLAITYITRRAKGKSNLDNTEQRARWFGYKADYMDVCRVFTTKDIKEDFSAILDHDEDMWASIERARDRGVPFKDMPRIFKLARSAFLRITRVNVAKTESYSFSEIKPQKHLVLDENVAQNNIDIITSFRNSRSQNITMETYSSVQVHAVLKNQRYDVVYSELLSKIRYHDREVLNREFYRLLNEALRKLDLFPPVDIYWLRDGTWSTRKILDDGLIEMLFQGRNPNTISPNYYKGDRSLVDKAPDHIQLQIQYIKPTNMSEINYYSPAFALYIPEYCSGKLSNLVVKSNG